MGPADKELLFLHETSVGNKLFGNDFSRHDQGNPRRIKTNGFRNDTALRLFKANPFMRRKKGIPR